MLYLELRWDRNNCRYNKQYNTESVGVSWPWEKAIAACACGGQEQLEDVDWFEARSNQVSLRTTSYVLRVLRAPTWTPRGRCLEQWRRIMNGDYCRHLIPLHRKEKVQARYNTTTVLYQVPGNLKRKTRQAIVGSYRKYWIRNYFYYTDDEVKCALYVRSTRGRINWQLLNNKKPSLNCLFLTESTRTYV